MLVWQHVRSRAVELTKKMYYMFFDLYYIYVYFDIVNQLEKDFVETNGNGNIIYNGYSHQLYGLAILYSCLILRINGIYLLIEL